MSVIGDVKSLCRNHAEELYGGLAKITCYTEATKRINERREMPALMQPAFSPVDVSLAQRRWPLTGSFHEVTSYWHLILSAAKSSPWWPSTMPFLSAALAPSSRKPKAGAKKHRGKFCAVCQTCSFESTPGTTNDAMNEADFHAIEHQAPHDVRIFLSSQVPGGRKYMLGIRATYAWAEVLQWGRWLFAGWAQNRRSA